MNCEITFVEGFATGGLTILIFTLGMWIGNILTKKEARSKQ